MSRLLHWCSVLVVGMVPALVPCVARAQDPAADGAGESAPKARDTERADEIPDAGYVPGYRRYYSLGLSPYAPRSGTLPGGLTPAYGAPTPSDEWTFRWSGYMSASLQVSFDDDERTGDIPGQNQLVFHVPPAVIDEWAAFNGTRTQPGNWIGTTFSYGNRYATANVSIDTWNPTRPTTYYQLGSQYFLNKIFLSITPDPIGDLRLSWVVGYFSNSYGNLSRYGSGMYANPLIGTNTGVGETTTLEYDVSENVTGVLEHGIMGDRDGRAPEGIVSSGATGADNPAFPAAFIHHAHAGLIFRGDTEFRLNGHYMTNWSQDDSDQAVDNTNTRFFLETDVKDGRITVVGLDGGVNHPAFGYLGVGVAYLTAHDAYPLRGLETYAGTGVRLTDSWLGFRTVGTGSVLVAAVNYSASLGRIVNYPRPFPGNHADVQIDTAFHLTRTTTDFEPYDGRLRYKYAAGALYHMFSMMSAGFRADYVVPNSEDTEETFYVLNPFLQFRTNWNSHETLNLMYARWFFGERTRKDGSFTPAFRLDDSMVALNFTMWW